MHEWSQDYESITITIPVDDGTSFGNIIISTTRRHLIVTILFPSESSNMTLSPDKSQKVSNTVLDGELYSDIYGGETNWYLESDPTGKKLIITLSKVPKPDSYGWWRKLIITDTETRDVPDMRPLREFTPESQNKILRQMSISK